MNVEWTTVQSSQKQMPKIVDETSSEYYVYLRRNIVEKKYNDEQSGEIHDSYEYEEAKLTHEEYKEYQKQFKISDLQQLRADIDYIALCSGIDLEI